MDTIGASKVVAFRICKYHHPEENLRRQMELMQLLGELAALGVEIISVMTNFMNNGRYCAADTIVCSHSQRSIFLCILVLSSRLHGCGIPLSRRNCMLGSIYSYPQPNPFW